VSQFICHIKTVRYRTVQFSMKARPDGQWHSAIQPCICVLNQSLNCDNFIFKTARTTSACLLMYQLEIRHLNVTSVWQLFSVDFLIPHGMKPEQQCCLTLTIHSKLLTNTAVFII